MKSLKLILLLFLLPCVAFAQYFGERPDWADGYFRDARNTYIESVSAFGYDIQSAKEKAIREVLLRRAPATGVESSVTINEYGDVSVKANKEYVRVKSRVLDDYVEKTNNGYYVWLLVQTAKNPEYEYENVMITYRYKFSGREFVPGMAQIYKGQVGKGVGFIVSEIAFVGGLVASESLRANYDAKVGATHSVAIRNYYTQNAQICAIARNVCIGGTVAVYLWSFIDGCVAKGKKHIEVGHAQLQFAPYATDNGGGLALNFKF